MPSPRPRLFRPAHALLLLLVPVVVQIVSLVRAEHDGELGQRQETRIEKHLGVAGRTVVLNSSISQVEVGASEGEDLHLTARLRYLSNDEEWMSDVARRFEVKISEWPDRIEIEPSLPEHGEARSWLSHLFHGRWTKLDLEITLAVPPGTALDLSNRYGAVTVRQVGGPLKLVNVSGPVIVEGAAGKVEIENRFGDLTVTDIEGDLVAHGQSGKMDIRRVSGDSLVENRYGPTRAGELGGALTLLTQSSPIEVAGAGGKVTVDGSYAEITIADVAGDLALTTRSSPLQIARIGGAVQITGSHARVEIDGVEGDAEVDSTGAPVVVRGVGGRIWVQNHHAPVSVEAARGDLVVVGESSPVEARQIAGAVNIETSHADVLLRGVGGAITIINEAGGIEISGLTGEALGARHEVRTAYGDIDFVWPAEAPPPPFRLEASYGEPSADFPASRTRDGDLEILTGQAGASEEADAAEASVVLSSPGESGQITLVARSGSPHLRRP